ncbi:MAG: GNAT family N-acetyltransferase [Steroidobacteraceae bacterium]|jgi:predicted N-acetyltransferase YhbS
MAMLLRKGETTDGPAVGTICYRAFKAIADGHSFPPDFPSPEITADLLTGLIDHEGFFNVVAEIDGTIVGSGFLDERNLISGIGPVTVDPSLQNEGAGRSLMQAVMRRSHQRGVAGIRLVQAGYHSRTLALYLKLGFEVREPLACLQGPAVRKAVAGHAVRPATSNDLSACNQLCSRVHGHERGGELTDAIVRGVGWVAERAGRVTGYATPIAFFGHAVGETNDDIKALIGASDSFPGPGFLVPTRNGELMRWCLAEGLRITQTLTLMTIGLYNRPEGAWLPSVAY